MVSDSDSECLGLFTDRYLAKLLDSEIIPSSRVPHWTKIPMSIDINTTLREYRLTTLQKRLYLAYAAAILVGAGISLNLATDPFSRYFDLVVGFLALGIGLILVLLALRSRLILDGDRIELSLPLESVSHN